jgi:hypothetical protein
MPAIDYILTDVVLATTLQSNTDTAVVLPYRDITVGRVETPFQPPVMGKPPHETVNVFQIKRLPFI